MSMSTTPKLPKGLPVESFDPGDLVYTAKDMEDFRAAGERAARAAERDAIDELLRDMIKVDGYGPKNTHWNAALQRAIDALRARGEGGEG